MKKKKPKRIKGIKNKHQMPYATMILTKEQKKDIREIRKVKEFPNAIKLNPKWDEVLTTREKAKALKYIEKTKQLQYNIYELQKKCRGVKRCKK
jgi:hypothetical protein